MLEQYSILSETITVEEEIKHSRFITVVFPCNSHEKFKMQYQQIIHSYPGASHYCYSFILDRPDSSIHIGSSDDGEPAGSAGRPMLTVLQGANIGEIAAVVIRYFGGTKLGVGGLVRAYSSGIRKAILDINTEIKLIRYYGVLYCDYAMIKDIEYLIVKHQGLIRNKEFTHEVKFDFALPLSEQNSFNQALATMSQGRLHVKFENTPNLMNQ